VTSRDHEPRRREDAESNLGNRPRH